MAAVGTLEELDELPAMGASFARALLPRRDGEVRIPEHAVSVRDHEQDIGRLADYVRVCGYTLRDHVPATWIHVLTFPLHVHLLGDPRSAVRLLGAVHVSNSMTLRRPVGVTERLTLTVRVENLRPHRRGALVDLVGEAGVGDETVWEGVSTYLASGLVVPGEPEEPAREPYSGGEPMARWHLPSTLGRQYRRVSGDPNPIHTSRLAARAFGFARPIIHGMWTHARALAALDGRLPDAWTANVAFARPILLPSVVGLTATPAAGGYRAAVTTVDGATPYLRMDLVGAAP